MTDTIESLQAQVAALEAERDRAKRDAEYLQVRIQDIADELDGDGRFFTAAKSWPKGANGPIAVAAYEALVQRAERAVFMLRAARMRTQRDINISATTESKLSIAVAALERIRDIALGVMWDGAVECDKYVHPYTCESEHDPEFCSNCLGDTAREALERINNA